MTTIQTPAPPSPPLGGGAGRPRVIGLDLSLKVTWPEASAR